MCPFQGVDSAAEADGETEPDACPAKVPSRNHYAKP